MMGLRQKESAEYLINTLKLEISAETYLAQRNKRQNELFAQGVKLLPGVRTLIIHLHNHKIPIAVASSSHHAAYVLKTKLESDIFALFPIVVLGDNPAVKEGKPAPDIFIEAAKQLGFDSNEEGLVFEDAPAGVMAGRAAGMKVVWVPDERCDVNKVLRVGQNRDKVEVLKNLTEFMPTKYGLPPY